MTFGERLSRVLTGFRDAVLPNRTPEELPSQPLPADEAHASGHRHRGPPQENPSPRPAADPTDPTVVSHRSGHVRKG